MAWQIADALKSPREICPGVGVPPLCHVELPPDDVLDALENHLPECPLAHGEYRQVIDVELLGRPRE